MDYTSLIPVADAFAEKAHRGQIDKSGVAYIEHPRTVASFVDTPFEKVVALLHDTVEDTDTTIEEIEKIFGAEVARCVNILTHTKDETYFEYIDRVKTDKDCTKVKLADLRHNMDLSRMPSHTPKDIARQEKYKKAKQILLDSL